MIVKEFVKKYYFVGAVCCLFWYEAFVGLEGSITYRVLYGLVQAVISTGYLWIMWKLVTYIPGKVIRWIIRRSKESEI